MKSIKQQIIKAKQEKIERENELWFVDYCNNCKTGLAFKNDVPCHHPYYCWHEGEAAIVQQALSGQMSIEDYMDTLQRKCMKNINDYEKDNGN